MFGAHQWSNRNSQGITKQMNLEDIKIDTIEHQLSINSKDRATEYYPNPFNFKITFGDKCLQNIPESKRHANILRRFKYIKYFSVEKVILPDRLVKKFMYITVTIKGIRNDNYHTTSDNNRDAITNLYKTHKSGIFACFEPYVFQKRFAYIEGEINNLLIIFKDPDGNILGDMPLEKYTSDDKSHILINLIIKKPILNH